MKKLFLMVSGIVCLYGSSPMLSAQDLPGMTAAIVNCEAYRNYDVGIKHWDSKVAEDGSFESEVVEESRLIIDYEKEQVAYFKLLSVSNSVPPSEKGKKYEMVTNLIKQSSVYRDGAYESDVPFAAREGKNISFRDFLRLMKIPLMEYASISKYPCIIFDASADENERRLGLLETFKKPQSRLDADGGRRELWINESETTLITRVFDREYLSPVQLSLTNIVDGIPESKARWKQTNTLENSQGVCRLVSSKSSEDSQLEIEIGKRVKVAHINTLSLTWHQFNEEEIKFPNEEKLVPDENERLKFIRAKAE